MLLFVSVSNNLSMNLLEKLISSDSLDKKNVFGNSVLHIAAATSNLDTVKYLILKGAEIDSLNSSEETPLFFAIRAKNIDVANYLIHLGADVNIKNKNGKSALNLIKEHSLENNIKLNNKSNYVKYKCSCCN